MPAHIDWEGMASHLGYSSVKEMLETEVDKTKSARYVGHNATTFAIRLGVSDVSLRTKMKKLGIPRPPRGRQYPFFPERFGFKTEEEMFRNLVLVEKMAPNEIKKYLKGKITEHPVRLQTITLRLKKFGVSRRNV